jgi:hypothetical protein
MQKSDLPILNPAPLKWPLSVSPHPQVLASLWLWGTLLLLTLAWDASGSDLSAMTWLGGPDGFAWREHWWLSNVMHFGAKQLAVLLYLGVLAMSLWPLGIWQQLTRSQRLEIAMGITLSLVVVTAIKRISLTSCPWELQAFGGAASYVSHWSWGEADGGWRCVFSGRARLQCFCFHRAELAVVDVKTNRTPALGGDNDRDDFAERVGLGAVANPQRCPLPQPHCLDGLGLRSHGLGQPWFVCLVARQARTFNRALNV